MNPQHDGDAQAVGNQVLSADEQSGRPSSVPRVLHRLGVVPPDDPARRATYQGFGNALALAFELAVTPVLFALGGHFLDRWLGITPVLTLALLVLAIVGLFAREWYAYDARMRTIEASGPWAPRGARLGVPAVVPVAPVVPPVEETP